MESSQRVGISALGDESNWWQFWVGEVTRRVKRFSQIPPPCNLLPTVLQVVVPVACWESLLPYCVNLYPHCTPVIQKGAYGTLLAECRKRLFLLVPGAGLQSKGRFVVSVATLSGGGI